MNTESRTSFRNVLCPFDNLNLPSNCFNSFTVKKMVIMWQKIWLCSFLLFFLECCFWHRKKQTFICRLHDDHYLKTSVKKWCVSFFFCWLSIHVVKGKKWNETASWISTEIISKTINQILKNLTGISWHSIVIQPPNCGKVIYIITKYWATKTLNRNSLPNRIDVLKQKSNLE